MKTSQWALIAASAILAAGCQSTAQFMQQMEPVALQTAVKRGQFEMSCPAATGTILSKSLLQPAIQAIRFSGPERGEFSVGVAGCGKRATYTVICPMDGSNSCWDVGAHNIIQ